MEKRKGRPPLGRKANRHRLYTKVSDELLERLQKEVDRRGVSISQLLRELLTKKYGKRKRRR